MAIGPVQMLVLGFAEPNFTGKIAAELDRLREHEFVKIVDALVVNKDENGEITALQVSDLSQDEATEMGAIAGALIGFGYGTEESASRPAPRLGAEAMADGHLIPDEEAWYVADAIPNGSAAAIILLEHLWAIPLRERDRRGRRHRARRRVDPPEGPDRGRRRRSRRVGRHVGIGVAADVLRPPRAPAVAAPSDSPRHDRPGSPSSAGRRLQPAAMPDPRRAAPQPELRRARSSSARSSASRSRRSPTSSSRRSPRRRSTCSTTLPGELGFDSQPSWWPIPFLALSGLLVAADDPLPPGNRRATSRPRASRPAAPVQPIDLPGIIIASFATLSLGVVLGPEAPLIAIGSGMGVLAVHLVKRDAPEMASVVIGAAGSFAAISTLLGSPLAGAFLLMEAGGLGGAMMGVVLVPGLARRRHRVAHLRRPRRLDRDSGRSRSRCPTSPPLGSPTGAEFLWAIAIGVLAAIARHVHQAAGARAPADRRASGASS